MCLDSRRSAADWSALFGVQERGLSEATGALIYSCFSITMACTRLCGEAIQRRWGAPRVLIGGAEIGGLGLATAVMAPSPALTFAGFAVAAVGLAYASPVVMQLSGAAGQRTDGGGGEREVAHSALPDPDTLPARWRQALEDMSSPAQPASA